jgi:hypothetical protein
MKRCNFLTVEYGDVGFLINKNQFYSSCYLEDEIPLETKLPYANRVFQFEGEKILVFDLHQALREIFRLDHESKAKLLLIVRTASLSPPVQEALSTIQYPGGTITRELIGLRIKSDARMQVLKIEELRLLPASLRAALRKFGVLACFFPGEKSADFLIEIDSIFRRCLDTAPAAEGGS